MSAAVTSPAAPVGPHQLHDPILPYVRPPALMVRPDDTVAKAIDVTRALPSTEIILYCYVVDRDGRLVGYVPVRRLLTTPPETAIRTIMVEDVMAIPSWATVLVAAEFFVNRRLLAFPVVEAGGRLVGVVDVSLFTDDLIALARQSFDGIFQLIGVHATEALTPWTSFKDRFPWLLCNVGGGLLCAVLSSRYEALLDSVVVLALFIPIVLALAESVSIQSVTLTLQNLQTGAIRWPVFGRALAKEAATALMLGLACGTLVGGVAWGWQRSPQVAAVLAAAICASMVTACLLGVALPTVLRALEADPKIAAGPIVLATTDLLTLLFYFTLAGRVLA